MTDATVDPGCIEALGDVGTITSYYDPTLEKIVIEAVLPDGSYAGWGWGDSMTETEMIIFSANGADTSAKPYYATTEATPQPAVV